MGRIIGSCGMGIEGEGEGTGEAGAVSGEETSAGAGDKIFDSPIDGSQPLTLRPGEGIVIKQGALASAGAISIVARIGVA